MQYIFIQDLRAETIIGVYPEERVTPQTLRFDVEVGIADRRAFHSDRLGETVDYAAVAELIKRELATQEYLLLEKLAEHLCQRIEREFDAPWIRMRVAKFGIVPDAEQVGVVLERGAPATPSVRALYGDRIASTR